MEPIDLMNLTIPTPALYFGIPLNGLRLNDPNLQDLQKTMTKYKLEYIWLDGKTPVPDLRGKTLIKAFEHPPTLADLPNWGFDGSSTMQAEGHKSDCVLKPVALYPDASR